MKILGTILVEVTNKDLNEQGHFECPKEITEIGRRAFKGCSNLTNVDLPQSITKIGDEAFVGCVNLTTMDLPQEITIIGGGAFRKCSNLIFINLPQGITEIEDHTFAGCSNLATIDLPLGVVKIEHSAFSGCSNLTAINLPLGITEIETETFAFCTKLTQITFHQGITKIGLGAFDGCSNLIQIDLPQGITTVREGAFSFCSNLIQITMHQEITTIHPLAFEGCTQLTNVFIEGDEPAKIYPLLPQSLKEIVKESYIHWFLHAQKTIRVSGLSGEASDHIKSMLAFTSNKIAFFKPKNLALLNQAQQTEPSMKSYDDYVMEEATVLSTEITNGIELAQHELGYSTDEKLLQSTSRFFNPANRTVTESIIAIDGSKTEVVKQYTIAHFTFEFRAEESKGEEKPEFILLVITSDKEQQVEMYITDEDKEMILGCDELDDLVTISSKIDGAGIIMALINDYEQSNLNIMI